MSLHRYLLGRPDRRADADSSAIYFQAPSQTLAVFGDGLRCAADSVIRLGTKNNVSGSSQYPEAGDLSISARAQVLAPGTRYYQCWYRRAASFCRASTFYLISGWSVDWAFSNADQVGLG